MFEKEYAEESDNFKLGKLIISIGEKSIRKYTAPDFLNVKQHA